jgi:hypothetical protein
MTVETTCLAVSDRKAAMVLATWGTPWFKYDAEIGRWDAYEHTEGGMVLRLCYVDGEWVNP